MGLGKYAHHKRRHTPRHPVGSASRCADTKEASVVWVSLLLVELGELFAVPCFRLTRCLQVQQEFVSGVVVYFLPSYLLPSDKKVMPEPKRLLLSAPAAEDHVGAWKID